eukprot:NODE_692_length_5142_cov_0.116597.p4 type:complete len:105 gc:universal NODE_692_length_5142_cov_0.116597:2387-2073(-)
MACFCSFYQSRSIYSQRLVDRTDQLTCRRIPLDSCNAIHYILFHLEFHQLGKSIKYCISIVVDILFHHKWRFLVSYNCNCYLDHQPFFGIRFQILCNFYCKLMF